MKVLLTGFEPFGKQTLNPSELIVLELANRELDGVRLATAILPVHRTKGPEKLLQAFEESRPDAVLMLGEAGGYPVPTIERVFVNLIEYPAEMGGGIAAVNEKISPKGPAAYFATWPVFECCERIVAAGIPCRLSLSAGSYLCNQIGYVIHDHIRRQQSPIPAGLIHVPFAVEQAASMPPGAAWPSMSVETLVRCVSIALTTVAEKMAKTA